MRRTGRFNGSTRLAVALAAVALAGCASVSGEAHQAELSPVVPPTAPPAPEGVNPFVGARLYVNPDYVKAVQGLEATHTSEASLLKRMESLPTAIWLSWIADTKEVSRYLDDALQQQKAGGQPVVPLFVVYDLPGRDCAAESSAGELAADAAGEARYQHAFIDVIAAAFRAHPDQRIAVVLEPDSLSNLVTNLERPRCQTAEGIYKRGIAYAISKLSLPNVFLYLEAAHAGWLGFPKNIDRAAALYKNVLTMAGGPDRVRGFALNVSNYDPAVDPAKTPRDSNLRRQRRDGLRRRPRQGPRPGRRHRQGVRHRHRPRRARVHPLDRLQLVQRQRGRSRRAATRGASAAHRRLPLCEGPGRVRWDLRPERPPLRSDLRLRRRHARRTPGREDVRQVPHRAPQERQPAALRASDGPRAEHV